jgi:hypothetical protein
VLCLNLLKDDKIRIKDTRTGEEICVITPTNRMKTDYTPLGFEAPPYIEIVRDSAIVKTKKLS